MQFEFATSARIIFGAGTIREAGPAAAALGRRALLVLGRTPARAQRLIDELKSRQVECVSFSVTTEPTTDLVQAGIRRAREERCDLIIGLGGGSVLDAGKAIAAMLTNPGELSDYLEVIGLGKPLTQSPAPYIAIPTTAGTGTEVTRNAVLASPEHRVKVSLRSPLMPPKLAVVDPELTHGLPSALTASTGMDALTQLIEPYVSIRANPLTDGFCLDGLRRVARSLRRAYQNGQDADAREDMALASLLGGLALANAGLGAVHGFAGPLGGMFPAPHGAVCAALLPHVMRTNVRALRERQPANRALQRYDEIARILTGHEKAMAEQAIAWVTELCVDLQIASLKAFSVEVQDLQELVTKSAQASSMRGNPIALTTDELTEILTHAL
jgi:alcohol dehydrogenase class IV